MNTLIAEKTFDGDLLIIDPVNLIKDDANGDTLHFISDNMIETTLYNINYHLVATKIDPKTFIQQELGQAYGESGHVCVCLLDEVVEFKPTFLRDYARYYHVGIVIPNFKGNVLFNINKEEDEFRIKGKGNIVFTISDIRSNLIC